MVELLGIGEMRDACPSGIRIETRM